MRCGSAVVHPLVAPKVCLLQLSTFVNVRFVGVLWRSFPPIGRHCHRRRLRDDVSALELSGVGVSIGVHGWRRLFLRQSDSE